MSEELSLIRFNVLNFFAVLLNARPFHPVSTLLIKLVEALINSETEPDKKMLERVEWLYENVHEKVGVPLAIVELATFKNLDRGLNRELELMGKTFHLTSLYRYLDDVSRELKGMVITIAKKYAIDMPMQRFMVGNQSPNINLD